MLRCRSQRLAHALCRGFTSKTATASGHRPLQAAIGYGLLVTAIATTQPVGLFPSYLGEVQHDQSSIPSTCQISTAYRHGELASIPHLLRTSRPSTILLAVRTVVVYAIEGMHNRRTWSYVLEKLCKALSPFVHHVDAAPAVVLVRIPVRVVTPTFGTLPRRIFDGVFVHG